MLVVCALVLVVAAFGYLVLGLVGGDVGDLYLSMALCAGSLVVLLVSARVSRPRAEPAGDRPEPVAPAGQAAAEAARVEADRDRAAARELATAGAGGRGGGLAERLAEEPEEDPSIWAATPAGEEEAAAEEPPAPPPPAPEPDGFPIADYDRLEAAQVLSLVPELWPEEIPVVAARERATRARPAVLDALAEAAGDPALAFPIAEYDALATEQITPLLDRLDPDDLDVVRTAERAGEARVGVLAAVASELAARR